MLLRARFSDVCQSGERQTAKRFSFVAQSIYRPCSSSMRNVMGWNRVCSIFLFRMVDECCMLQKDATSEKQNEPPHGHVENVHYTCSNRVSRVHRHCLKLVAMQSISNTNQYPSVCGWRWCMHALGVKAGNRLSL